MRVETKGIRNFEPARLPSDNQPRHFISGLRWRDGRLRRMSVPNFCNTTSIYAKFAKNPSGHERLHKHLTKDFSRENITIIPSLSILQRIWLEIIATVYFKIICLCQASHCWTQRVYHFVWMEQSLSETPYIQYALMIGNLRHPTAHDSAPKTTLLAIVELTCRS